MELVEYRRRVRDGSWAQPTRGVAPGHVQCNLVMLPAADADGFARWCAANPAVAPVIARSEPGDPRIPALGTDIDLRTDLPRYRIFVDGEGVESRTDVSGVWREDLVTFAFGCSFSLEEALVRHGVPLPGVRRGFTGAIYQTTRETVAVDAYAGRLVVSMRPVPLSAVDQVIEISERYPWLHGAPVHVGDPAALGIELDEPLESLGEVSVLDDEAPVFWACGVTTQRVMESARPEFAITHESAHMLVTDLTLDTVPSPA